MNQYQLQPVWDGQEGVAQLRAELQKARRAQLAAEAELAQEQAAVNAFRMHCRLRLDALVDELLELRSRKEALWGRLALLRQGLSAEWLDEQETPLDEPVEASREDADELILPTPVPHDKAAEKRLFRELARRFHPDLARSSVERAYRTTVMAAVNEAYAARDTQALYDLAEELEPGEIVKLAGVEDIEARRLREAILRSRQHRRKAERQLNLLRQENTARLWQRARVLDAGDEDWWTLVQHELAEAIRRLQADTAALEECLAKEEPQQAAP